MRSTRRARLWPRVLAALSIAAACGAALPGCDRTASAPGPSPEAAPRPVNPQSGLAPIEDVVRFVENLGTASLSEESAKRLTFVAIDVSTNSIVGIDADGQPLGPLATDPAQKSDLAVTRDGSRIAFVRRIDQPIKRYDVVTMARDGRDKRILTLAHPDVAETERQARAGNGRKATRYENPYFAPDGRSLVLFAEMPDRREGVFRLDAGGAKLESLAESTRAERGAAHYRFPCLSSDGLRFACVRRVAEANDEGLVEEIVLVTIEGRAESPVHRAAPNVVVRPLAFAPDDSSLLVVEVGGDSDSRLVLLPLGGGGAPARTLVTARNAVGSFSPDGRSVVYSAERADSEEIYVVAVEGGDPRRLTRAGGRLRGPVWLPAAR